MVYFMRIHTDEGTVLIHNNIRFIHIRVNNIFFLFSFKTIERVENRICIFFHHFALNNYKKIHRGSTIMSTILQLIVVTVEARDVLSKTLSLTNSTNDVVNLVTGLDR